MTFSTEREREGVQELYSYCRGTTVEDRELDFPAKLSFHCRLRKLLIFNLRATRELTSSYVEEGMELDIPGKKNSYLRSILEKKSKK